MYSNIKICQLRNFCLLGNEKVTINDRSNDPIHLNGQNKYILAKTLWMFYHFSW